MLKSYTEVNQDIILTLKNQGYTSVEFVPRDSDDNLQATIELIPGSRLDFNLNVLSLDSPEIVHYLNGGAPMARYIINPEYLVDNIDH
ncbi:hypothetical protein [Daejeonella sp.]|uniref:hypothetical protein n=1 Tax=Daejeonella sp. TaxID=2805397 RepID=UPI0030BCBC56